MEGDEMITNVRNCELKLCFSLYPIYQPWSSRVLTWRAIVIMTSLWIFHLPYMKFCPTFYWYDSWFFCENDPWPRFYAEYRKKKLWGWEIISKVLRFNKLWMFFYPLKIKTSFLIQLFHYSKRIFDFEKFGHMKIWWNP